MAVKRCTPALERIFRRCVEEDRGFTSPCLIWTGGTVQTTGGPYGVIQEGRRGTKMRVTHVLVWQAEHGEKPPGYEVDHLCRQTLCVRLSHLEAVPHKENMRRTRGELCRKGLHPMSGDNVLHPEGRRTCRACKNDYQRAYNQARREGVMA